MAKIKAYVISCSGDAIDLDIRNLFVWGGYGYATWLPKIKVEIMKRLEMCRRENKCAFCDAEIHKIIIERTKLTFKNIESQGEKTNSYGKYQREYYQKNKERYKEYQREYRKKHKS